MSHAAQQNFVNSVLELYPEDFINTRVAEIGSLNINGTVREFFTNPSIYVGCDLGIGPGVDIVCYGHQLPYKDEVFDVTISCECFEHDKHWQRTFQKMYDLLKPGGLLVFTCATTGRAEHGTTRTNPKDAPFTNDYYQNLTDSDFTACFDFATMFESHAFSTNQTSYDLYFWGRKCKK